MNQIEESDSSKARYWATKAGQALREAFEAREELDRTKRTAEMLADMQGEALREVTAERDALRESAQVFARGLERVVNERDRAVIQLAESRGGAVLAMDAYRSGDKFSGGLLAQSVISKLAAPLNGIAADDVALKATAEALASFTMSDNEDVEPVCSCMPGWDGHSTSCPAKVRS